MAHYFTKTVGIFFIGQILSGYTYDIEIPSNIQEILSSEDSEDRENLEREILQKAQNSTVEDIIDSQKNFDPQKDPDLNRELSKSTSKN